MRRQTSYRTVVGLQSARRLSCKPACIPIGRPRGIKAQGIRYERAVARALLKRYPKAGIDFGVWFEYNDANGHGYCQVDVLIYNIAHDCYIVGECKLTDTPSARGQLAGLYLPVVSKWQGSPAAGLVIARNLTPETPTDHIYDNFRAACGAATPCIVPVWHYLGRGAVM